MPKILAIDDKQDNLVTVSALLRNLIPDCTVITSDSGAEGLKKAEAEQPDAILLDIKMPEMDGFEVCRRLKSNEKAKHIPVVMLTGIKTDAESRIKGLELGADAFLSKPIDEVELAVHVKVMLRIKTAEDLLRKKKDLLEDTVHERAKALRESEETYRQLFATVSDAIMIFDAETREFLDVNEAALKMYGYNKEEFLSLKHTDVTSEEESDKSIKQLLSGELTRIPLRYHKRKDGTVFPIEISSGKIKLRDKDLLCWIIRDIAERKRAEEELKKAHENLEERTIELCNELQERKKAEERLNASEKKSLTWLEYSPVCTKIVDLDFNLQYMSAAGVNGLNIDDITEFYGKPYPLAFYPESFKTLMRMNLKKVKETGEIIEQEGSVNDIDGRKLWFHSTLVPVNDDEGRIDYIMVVSADITARKKAEEELKKAHDSLEIRVEERTAELKKEIAERKQAEEALQESEELHKEAQRVARIGHWELHPETGTPVWSDEIFRIFGLNPQESEPSFTDHETHLHPDDWPLLNKAVTLASTEGTPFDIIFRIVRPDSEIGWMHAIGTTTKDEKGKVTKLFGTAQDITKQKQAEEALRESEEKYRTILETIEDGYYEIDLGGNFTFFNDSMCKISGYSRDELMGMNNRRYTDEVYAKEIYQTFNKVYTTGKPAKSFHWPVIRKDGTKRTVAASVSLRRDTEGEPMGFRGIVRDISERKRFEAQLQQVTKMEAIAILAGGVAHEFNNALMGVMGNIELLKIDLPEDERRDKYFEAMESASHRMARLTAQLLAYAEGGKYQPKDLKLDDFVIETLPILQHNLSPTVETVFPKDISHVKADHAQMQMVLSAILANSNEAIEDEGIIRITAENKDLDEDFTKQHPGLKPGPYVCLTIEDDGKGMDEETRSGIFEPFFTTKFQGRGMGMAATYGIIKSHDGAITVDSEPGKGTVVSIYLPAIEAKKAVKKEKVLSPAVKLPMGEGTILVIEDEETLVMMFKQILERLGYRVLLAETGKEAVELAKTFDGQIDLALLDIKLSDMDGGRVYPLIMEARPDLKVIVCSGYSIHGPAQHILDAGAEGFIQKPFSIAPFAEKLKEVLEGK